MDLNSLLGLTNNRLVSKLNDGLFFKKRAIDAPVSYKSQCVIQNSDHTNNSKTTQN